MRRKCLVFALFLVATTGTVVLMWSLAQRAPRPPLSQADIEAKAVVYAKSTGWLQGTPISIISRQMTGEEFNARLDPFSNDSAQAATQFWFVMMKADFAVAGPPGPDNNIIFTKYDNGWILLSTDGEIIGRGNQAPGYELDLNAPATPLTSRPTPENPKK